jgi:hypothetical protein
MKLTRSFARTAAATTLALAGFGLAGCTTYGDVSPDADKPAGGQTAGGGDSAEEEASLEDVKLTWNGYTMEILLVSDDRSRVADLGVDFEGKPLKVCFQYQGDPADQGHFAGLAIFDDLEDHPIVVKDADGATYQYTGQDGVGDLTYGGNIGDLDSLVEFSITFDIPADAKVEDFEIDTGAGEPVALIPYVSDDYTDV